MSYQSGEAAEQVVKMTLSGVELAAKISGRAAERLAVLLYAILKDQKRTRGKIRLTSMIRSGKELKVFSVNDGELERFCKAAKKYGVLYCVLKDKSAADKRTDVFVRAEDASKINRIFERFGIATADMNSLKGEFAKERSGPDADIPAPDRVTTEKDKEEAFLDKLLAPVPNKEEAQTQNPTEGRTAKSRQSAPTSKPRAKTDRGISDSEGRPRRSVRQELREIKEEQRQKAESARNIEKPAQIVPEHIHVPAEKKNEKER